MFFFILLPASKYIYYYYCVLYSNGHLGYSIYFQLKSITDHNAVGGVSGM